MAKSDLQTISGILGQRYVAYYPSMVPDIGLKAAIILGKFIYWHGVKGTRQDGYFFKTFKQLYKETGITCAAQKPALKKLEDRGLVIADKYDYLHRRLFRVDINEVRKYAIELSKNSKPNELKSTYRTGQNHQTEKIHTEKNQAVFKEKLLKPTDNNKIQSVGQLLNSRYKARGP